MLCRRRFSRNPVLIILLLCICLAFFSFIKTGHLFFTSTKDSKIIDPLKSNLLQNHGKEILIDIDDNSLKEIERLESIDVLSNINSKIIKSELHTEPDEQLELMRKFNETLKKQEEENDPFKPLRTKSFVDFINSDPEFKDTDYKPEDLRPIVGDLNSRKIMYNNEKFENLPDNHPIIVIQVHKRVEYFKELLDSLQRTRGIENAVLVISHDFYSDTMNALIRMINFCQVIQIFFPYSLQLYPNEFPGKSKDDCARDLKKEQAIRSGCVNAQHPDKYGHYREAHITMTKHHWWWKINHVFDGLDIGKHQTGPVIFMEEDHYVAPSFYEALMALHDLKTSDPRCKDSCDILTMGTYNSKDNYQFEGDKVLLGNWISSQHNMGMAMYRSTWEKIKKCAQKFCTFDDYNWDWTLMHLSKTCLSNPLSVLVYEVPRMFHVGDCGLHHTKTCANSKNTLNKVKGIIERHKDFLFTDRVNIFMQSQAIPMVKPNGGWGDVRDHKLCHKFVKLDKNLIKR